MDLSLASIAAVVAAARSDPNGRGAAVAACAGRIEALNGRFRAYSHLAADVGDEVDRLGGLAGPLLGIAASVKGSIPVRGLPFTEGSALYAGRRAVADAQIVRRLRAAGAVVMGTTTLSELALYGVTNPFEPMGLNPWDETRTAGGSSTGAGVAAALGMAHLSIGSDSGGSIRNPACHCGVVGFMPRIGRLSLVGKPNHTPSLSSVGLIGRRVDDVRRGYEALADDSSVRDRPRTLAVPRRLIDVMCDDETAALFEGALARLSAAGVVVVDGDVAGWIDAERGAGIVSLAESGAALAGVDLSRAGEGIRRRREAAARLGPGEVDAARRAGRAFHAEASRVLAATGATAFATPTWPFPAPPLAAGTACVRGVAVPIDPHRNCFVRIANAVDACAVSVPMGLYASCGVPAGLHLMALCGEGELLALAAAAEAALPPLPLPPPVRARRPPVT